MLVPYLLKKIYPKQQHENIDNYIKWFQEFHSIVVYICCACFITLKVIKRSLQYVTECLREGDAVVLNALPC